MLGKIEKTACGLYLILGSVTFILCMLCIYVTRKRGKTLPFSPEEVSSELISIESRFPALRRLRELGHLADPEGPPCAGV